MNSPAAPSLSETPASVRYDYARSQRIGMPEAVLCQGKDARHLAELIEELRLRPDHPTLFTRLSPAAFSALSADVTTGLDYDPVSQTAIMHGLLKSRTGRIAIVTAGTADLRAALEAKRTLEFMGLCPALIADVGVAGIWRLMEQIDTIRAHDVVIAVAGMDAALVSVLGGLISKPLIGVPTSVGYGVAEGGSTALHSMLASCAQGVVVTNIDNGFGAACAALRFLGASQQ